MSLQVSSSVKATKGWAGKKKVEKNTAATSWSSSRPKLTPAFISGLMPGTRLTAPLTTASTYFNSSDVFTDRALSASQIYWDLVQSKTEETHKTAPDDPIGPVTKYIDHSHLHLDKSVSHVVFTCTIPDRTVVLTLWGHPEHSHGVKHL
nr:hypothetical protein BgiMline_010399 [Biomphalaria glabrata]